MIIGERAAAAYASSIRRTSRRARADHAGARFARALKEVRHHTAISGQIGQSAHREPQAAAGRDGEDAVGLEKHGTRRSVDLREADAVDRAAKVP